MHLPLCIYDMSYLISGGIRSWHLLPMMDPYTSSMAWSIGTTSLHSQHHYDDGDDLGDDDGGDDDGDDDGDDGDGDDDDYNDDGDVIVLMMMMTK